MAQKILTFIEEKPVGLWFLLAVVCFLPALFSPFYSDDFFHLLLLNNSELLQRDMPGSILGLFAFVDTNPESFVQMQNYSVIPWWADSHFYFRFWRPMAEMSHLLDYALLANTPWFSHAVSIIVFLLTAYLFLVLARRFVADKYVSANIAVLALVLFLLDGQHVATVSWVANRNALLAAFFSLASFIALIKALDVFKQNFCFAGLALYGLALLLFALALLSSEAAIAITVYFFFYSVFYQQGWGLRVKTLLPFALLSVFWFYCHQALGYGAEPSGNSYVNPFSHPDVFLFKLFESLPVYFFSHLTSSPAGAYWTLEGWQQGFKLFYWPLALLGSLGFIIWQRKKIAADKFLQFSLCCLVVSAIPASLANPQDRLSLMQSFAVAWFFAAIIVCAVKQHEYKLAGLLLFIHLVLSPLHLMLGGVYMNLDARKINQQLISFDADNSIAAKDIVLLDMPIGYNVMLTGVRAFFNKPLPNSILTVGNDAGVLSLQKLDEHRLAVRRSVPFATGFEAGFRNMQEQPFFKVQVICHPMANITITELSNNTYPKALVLHFSQPINNLLFYRFINGEIKPVDISQLSLGKPVKRGS